MIHHLKHALHRRLRPQRYVLLEDLLRHQRLDAAALAARQRAELEGIIAFARAHVPHYRESFPPHAARIEELPILDKDTVIARRDALLAEGLDPAALRLGRTGGSTGTPVSFYYDAFKGELMRAGMTRSYMMSGWRPGQKILNFWGARQDIKGDASPGHVLKSWSAAEKTLPAHDYAEADLSRWAGTVRDWQPVLLQGYASILAELARFVVANRLPMPRTLIGVYSTAETLHDWQRALMEQAFGCKVFNQYGSREIPNIACECGHGNLHVFTDMVHLESVRAGEEERLLLTALTNRVMPLIRYEIGDLGRLKEGACACGSPFPLMEMSLCRSNDLIATTAGKRVYPSWFIHLLDGLEGVRQFQFVQTRPDAITLYLAGAALPDADRLAVLQARIHAEIDAGMTLDVRHVDDIPRTASGKHRFVIRQDGAS